MYVRKSDLIPPFLTKYLGKDASVIEPLLRKELTSQIFETEISSFRYCSIENDKPTYSLYDTEQVISCTLQSKTAKPLTYSAKDDDTTYYKGVALTLSRRLEGDEILTVKYTKPYREQALYIELTKEAVEKIKNTLINYFKNNVDKDTINKETFLKEIEDG